MTELAESNRAAPLPAGFEPIALLSRANVYEAWDAWDEGRGCRVVVKAVRPDRAESRGAAERLLAEGRLLEELAHPHVVRALETVGGAQPAIVMESLGGATLARILDQEEPLEPAEIAHLGLQLASALGYLHGRRHLHLDLKPSNVIAEVGRARLIDLGLTSAPGRVGPELGTWCYMAPEQVGGKRVGTPADVWGLGAVLFECVAGFPPFDDPDREDEEHEYPQLHRAARPVESVRPVPGALAELVAACLRPDAAERPTLAVVASELEQIAGLPAAERRLSRSLSPPDGPQP